MRILFLSGWFPYPSDNGSKLRIYNLLRGLASHHAVTLLSFSEDQISEAVYATVRDLCRDVQVVPWKAFTPQSWRARLGLLSTKPRSVIEMFQPAMQAQIEQALAVQAYDLIIASQGLLASYSHCFRGLPALFEEVELGLFFDRFRQATTLRTRLRHGLTWLKQRHYIQTLLPRFRACTVVSHREQQLVRRIASAYDAVEIVPNGIHVADYRSLLEPVPNMLIFTGSFRYHANHEAMIWFLSKVWPLIQEQVPEARLTITGDHANLPLPPAPNVTLTGIVENIHPLLAQSWLSLAPLWSGGGTRLKILEAMATGTPVVATAKGAEGLGLQHNEHLLIADEPSDYASAVVSLLRDGGLRHRLARSAHQAIAQSYDWSAIMPRFLRLVEWVAQY
jgi:glycosyltransferase involved in cell wall biosynthesis